MVLILYFHTHESEHWNSRWMGLSRGGRQKTVSRKTPSTIRQTDRQKHTHRHAHAHTHTHTHTQHTHTHNYRVKQFLISAVKRLPLLDIFHLLPADVVVDISMAVGIDGGGDASLGCCVRGCASVLGVCDAPLLLETLRTKGISERETTTATLVCELTLALRLKGRQSQLWFSFLRYSFLLWNCYLIILLTLL